MKNMFALSVAFFLASSSVLAADAPSGSTPSTVTVTFSGTPPVMKKLNREADALCAKTPMKDEQVLVKDGKLQNVMVRVTRGADGSFPMPAGPAIVTQQSCMYRPRVQGIREGQAVTFTSEDDTTHNVHVFSGEQSIFNRVQTKGEFTKKATDLREKDGRTIGLKCDIHPWMSGFLLVATNPYFGVTDEKGETKLDLPPGKYTLEAWHERYGTKTQEIIVESGKPASVKFDYAGTEKPAL